MEDAHRSRSYGLLLYMPEKLPGEVGGREKRSFGEEAKTVCSSLHGPFETTANINSLYWDLYCQEACATGLSCSAFSRGSSREEGRREAWPSFILSVLHSLAMLSSLLFSSLFSSVKEANGPVSYVVLP